MQHSSEVEGRRASATGGWSSAGGASDVDMAYQPQRQPWENPQRQHPRQQQHGVAGKGSLFAKLLKLAPSSSRRNSKAGSEAGYAAAPVSRQMHPQAGHGQWQGGYTSDGNSAAAMRIASEGFYQPGSSGGGGVSDGGQVSAPSMPPPGSMLHQPLMPHPPEQAPATRLWRPDQQLQAAPWRRQAAGTDSSSANAVAAGMLRGQSSYARDQGYLYDSSSGTDIPANLPISDQVGEPFMCTIKNDSRLCS